MKRKMFCVVKCDLLRVRKQEAYMTWGSAWGCVVLVFLLIIQGLKPERLEQTGFGRNERYSVG